MRALAGEYTEQALRVLVDVMGDGTAPHGARVHAATALLDRGHGKPRQELEHSGPDGRDLIPATEVDPGKVALAILNLLQAARPKE